MRLASLAGAGREWVDESMKSIKRWISGPPGAAPMAVPTTERTDVIDVLLGKRSLGISKYVLARIVYVMAAIHCDQHPSLK